MLYPDDNEKTYSWEANIEDYKYITHDISSSFVFNTQPGRGSYALGDFSGTFLGPLQDMLVPYINNFNWELKSPKVNAVYSGNNQFFNVTNSLPQILIKGLPTLNADDNLMIQSI